MILLQVACQTLRGVPGVQLVIWAGEVYLLNLYARVAQRGFTMHLVKGAKLDKLTVIVPVGILADHVVVRKTLNSQPCEVRRKLVIYGDKDKGQQPVEGRTITAQADAVFLVALDRGNISAVAASRLVYVATDREELSQTLLDLEMEADSQ